MGGASENDEAMKWFLRKANTGDVVVLRTSGSDGYNTYFYTTLGININSVKTFVCSNRNASFDSTLINAIKNAEAIWFAGGNQWSYVSYWRNTPIDSIINRKLLNNSIVIGGTSAGMAILGSAYFSAQNGTVTSSTALQNPFDNKVTVDTTQFFSIPFLKNVITDTHYDSPDRKGRHSVFIAKGISHFQLPTKGIACDEYTAVCIDTNGLARVFGGHPTYDDNAYFLQKNCELSNSNPENVSTGFPLTWYRSGNAIKVYHAKGTASGSQTFDLHTWKSGTGGTWENWSINNGMFSSKNSSAPICGNTSITKVNSGSVRVYPNPASNIIQVKYEFEVKKIQLVQLNGKIMTSSNTSLLDITMISSGVYFLKIETQNGIITKKLIKQ